MFSLLKRRQQKPVYTHDWTSEVEPIWNRVLEPYKGTPGLRYLELGVFEGRSMIWMLENILTDPSAQAVGIDTFAECSKKSLVQNLRRAGVHKKVTLKQGNSQVLMKTLGSHEFNIIFVDADHRARGALADLVHAWDLLKVGGCLIFDDYAIHAPINPPEASVKVGADCFLTTYQNEFSLLYHDGHRQFIVKKEALHKDHYITQAGPFYFFWGTDPLDRKVMDSRTNTPVSMQQAELQALAQALLERPLGQVTLTDEAVPLPFRSSLKRKVPNFFQIVEM